VPTAFFSSCLKRIGSSLRLVWQVFILLKWPWNLAKIVLLVWPTYCLPHVVQLMQYIRLELLHVMFTFVGNIFFVTWHTIVPLLSRSGQKLHSVLAMHLFLKRLGLATAVREMLLWGFPV